MIVQFMGGYLLDEAGDKWWSHELLMMRELQLAIANAEIDALRSELKDLRNKLGL